MLKTVFLGPVVPATTDNVKQRIAIASTALEDRRKKIWDSKNI